MEVVLAIFPFLFGITWGSFANVLILRLPKEEDVVVSRSRCVQCKSAIAWYDNIPLLAYIWLKGRCRTCKSKISVQYPLIELWHGVVASFIFYHWWQFSILHIAQMLALFLIMSIFTIHFIIDLRYQLLLDKLNIALLIPVLFLVSQKGNWQQAVIGGVIGLLLPLAVTWLFYKLRGVIGLGGGDIKLFAILGLLFGIKGVMLNLFTSCLVGSVGTLSLMALGRISKEEPIPFGPYIILIAAVQLLLPATFALWGNFLIPY